MNRKYLYKDLNELSRLLGSTTPHIFAFFEFEGVVVTGWSSAGDLTPAETAGATESLEDDFNPVLLPSGLYALHFNPDGDHHLAGADSADFSFGSGTVDSAFTVSAWVNPYDITTERAILSKYDASGTDREWVFGLSSTAQSRLKLFDESNAASEIGVSTHTLRQFEMIHLLITYNGDEDDPVVTHYINGQPDVTTDTTESGTYVAMEAGATPLLVGATGTTAAPADEFHGQLALVTLSGGALTAQEAAAIYELTERMVIGTSRG